MLRARCDSGSASIPAGHTLLGIGARFEQTTGAWTWREFVRIDNLTDKQHRSSSTMATAAFSSPAWAARWRPVSNSRGASERGPRPQPGKRPNSLSGSITCAGRLMAKVQPAFDAASHQMRPPWRSTMRCASARPVPMPS